MRVEIEIQISRVYDLIITGLECGAFASFGVVDGAAYAKAWKSAERDKTDAFFAVRLFDRSDPEAPFPYLWDIELQRGLDSFAKEAPKQFADFLNENEDAETGDAFLQCVLLGEVIYG